MNKNSFFLFCGICLCTLMVACSDAVPPILSSQSGNGIVCKGEQVPKRSGKVDYYLANPTACVKVNIAIAAGWHHTCAILTDKSVKCWGYNGSGQTGGGTSSSDRTISGTAGDPLSGQTATHIAAGEEHTCAILTDKSVKCWGSNWAGQTGGGASTLYRTISGTAGDPLSGQTATHIVAGYGHTCAILTDKSVKCWGLNFWGQTGRRTSFSAISLDLTQLKLKLDMWGKIGGGTSSSSRTAGDPLSGQTATHIVAGYGHTCAILTDKSVKCRGVNTGGQTGGGTSSSSRTASGTAGGDPLSGQTATHIAAKGGHTCAILTDKSVKCWGSECVGPNRRGHLKFRQNDKRNGRRSLIGTNRYTHCGRGGSHLCHFDG